MLKAKMQQESWYLQKFQISSWRYARVRWRN